MNIGLKMLQGEIFSEICELNRNIIKIDDLTGLMCSIFTVGACIFIFSGRKKNPVQTVKEVRETKKIGK